jgi:hypothetical protein
VGLFGRRRGDDPGSWDELWAVLAPFGGRLTDASVEHWRAAAASFTPAQLELAAEQLGFAHLLLDTERHARELAPDGFAEPGRPFARGRFVRVLDAVVVAGPDAVARVAADPAALRSYADVGVLAPEQYYDLTDAGPPALGLELLRALVPAQFSEGAAMRVAAPRRLRWLASPGRLDRRRLGRWPSLRDRRGQGDPLAGTPDPEVPWLDLDASELDGAGGEVDGDGRDDDDGPATWYGAGFAAAARVFVALGPDALGGVSPGLVRIALDVTSGSAANGPGARSAPEATDSYDDGVLIADVALPAEDVAVTEPDERVRVLAARAAQALSSLGLTFSDRTRDALDALAGGR